MFSHFCQLHQHAQVIGRGMSGLLRKVRRMSFCSENSLVEANGHLLRCMCVVRFTQNAIQLT